MSLIDIEATHALEAATAATYADVADFSGVETDQAHTLRECHRMVQTLGTILDERYGIATRQELRSGWQVMHHSYLTMESTEGEIVIDPSWQQFLHADLRTEELPKTLVGTRDQVIEQAVSAGVDPVDAQLWAPRGVYPEPENLTPQQKIARAIDAM